VIVRVLLVVLLAASALVFLRDAGAPTKNQRDRSGQERDKIEKIIRLLGH
jgi:hypothetical protein